MQSTLSPHLDRIVASLDDIDSYVFSESKIFTNAILKSRDLVSFIRDTDAHERSLFTSTADPGPRARSSDAHVTTHRKPTVYSVLGGDMISRLRRGGASYGDVGDVDVDLLLQGAEKLSSVYQIPGVAIRISRARDRYEQLTESVSNYEALVESQRTQLNLLNQFDGDEPAEETGTALNVTDGMMEEQEAAIHELEAKKEELEQKMKILEHKMSSVYRSMSG